MGLKFKPLAVASIIAVTALLIQGLSPTAAAESGDAPVPAPAAATAPTEDSTPTSDASEAAEEPAEPEAPKLLDLTIGKKTSPIRLGAITLPLNLGSIDLNPEAAPSSASPRFGGGASGITATINAAGLVQVKTTKLGSLAMRPDGEFAERTAALVQVPELPVPLPIPDLNLLSGGAKSIKSFTGGYQTYPDKRPIATARTDVAQVGLGVYFAAITANGVRASARVERRADGTYEFTGVSHFADLSMGGVVNPTTSQVAPNTSYDLVGLGKVVLNEQKITQISGDRHGLEVNAIHITLDTAKFGLPVGADIYIGSAEAIIYE